MKPILLFFISITIMSTSHSQDTSFTNSQELPRFGVGLAIGLPIGLIGEYRFSERNAVATTLGYYTENNEIFINSGIRLSH